MLKDNFRTFVQLILLLFTICRVFSLEISGCRKPEDPKKACIKDFKLDILLMYDQSGSMQLTNYEKFRQASLEWVQAFFEIEGVDETQFAVMACEKQEILHRFADGNFNVEIPKAILKIVHNGTHDNLDLCCEKAVNEIFTSKYGDRADAKNLVLWISDCDFVELYAESSILNEYAGPRWNNSYQRHLNAAKALQIDKRADFYFICCKHISENLYKLDRAYAAVMKWLAVGNKGKDGIIRYDYDNVKLGKQAMDKIIPMKEVDVVDCVVKEADIRNCSYDFNVGRCVEKEIYLIQSQPYPKKQMGTKHGKDCPINVTTRVCSDCVIPEGQMPDGRGGAVNENKKSWIWITVGIVGSLVVLLCVLFVILFIVWRRRRRNLHKQQSLATVSKDEKGKGVKADLEINESRFQKKKYVVTKKSINIKRNTKV